MVEANAVQESYTYIPLISFIILTVILLTCASRRKKVDPFNGIEQSLENEIKAEYAIMCFPCLKKKPELKNFEPSADFSDQYEYIVEKYTIRKVPLLLANTTEDILERQEELEMAKIPPNTPQLLKDDFVNFQVAQEVYNVQKVPPCITVAAHAGCPGRKERPRASDILESMSPIPRHAIKNRNYVVIPTKGSVRSKDIMITKREITNQYLNNFSSVFVDNLKDQVPKDPEQFPSLSRPYTSALRNYPIPESETRTPHATKRTRRNKSQKVAYAFPTEDITFSEDQTIKEEPYYDSDSVADHTTYIPDSEFQEDLSDKSKSLVLLQDNVSRKEGMDCVPNPFKTTIKSSVSEIENKPLSSTGADLTSSFISQKEDWNNSKNVTYEDIQALDVGYEFTSCEKLGVKPKMTRIHYPHESERLKESLKQLALGDSSKISKRGFCLQESTTPTKMHMKPKPLLRSSELTQSLYPSHYLPPSEKTSSKSVITETSFLPVKENQLMDLVEPPNMKSFCQDQYSNTTFTSKSEEMRSQSANEADENVNNSVAEISKMYDLSATATQRVVDNTSCSPSLTDSKDPSYRYPTSSKSRSLDEPGRPGSRKENLSEGKGKLCLPNPNSAMKPLKSRKDEAETETSCSLCSHDSKTSSVVTSPRSSEPDEGKRATLRWKIVIKHHREEDSSRKNVNEINKH